MINDLVTDQRVHKVCTTLHDMGYDVLLVGRRRRESLSMNARKYRTHRMFLFFEKGPAFYAFFQLRLLFFLLFRRADVLVSNDLDTLWPNFFISKLKGTKLVYDAHEIFTEVPELAENSARKKAWKKLEGWLVPKLKHMFTVNNSIAAWYEKQYGIRPLVVRNMPRLQSEVTVSMTRNELGLPENKRIILLQGAGINIQRGAEEAVEAMQYVDHAVLLILGSGDVLPLLKEMVKKNKLEEKVIFIPRQPFEKLQAYTHFAGIGLTLDKDTNINYRFSLPNKIFDYIHAGVPVLASNLVEVRQVVEKYNVGRIAESHDPREIARVMTEMLASPDYETWKSNAARARTELCWEQEELQLKSVYSKFL
ncbi:MAG: group 1 glycosyl transferase [Bacteroidetes bacterium]|nr:MAG: group 1 glycosyl transferase [Bacteroidota bacterium]